MSVVRRAALLVALVIAAPADAATHTAKPGPRNAWGAIAYSSTTGAYGYAVDRPSRRAAEADAFRQCGDGCDVVHTFSNACGAIAETDRHYAWDTGASRELAEMKARRKCGADSCRTVVWACTRGK